MYVRKIEKYCTDTANIVRSNANDLVLLTESLKYILDYYVRK